MIDIGWHLMVAVMWLGLCYSASKPKVIEKVKYFHPPQAPQEKK